MGSRLYNKKDELVWMDEFDGVIDSLSKTVNIGNALKYSSRNKRMVVQNNRFDQAMRSPELREYGTQNEYKAIVEHLIK